MTGNNRAFRLYGTTQAEPAPRLLKAGRLTARLAGGNLRAIAYDGVEVLRAISYLVRDRDWGTYDPVVADLVIRETEAGFTVAYEAKCSGPEDTVLDISAAIEATSDGRLTFTGKARSTTGFETNRCGFCVLHPVVGVAGMPVTVEHVDGGIEETTLPERIAPWQPFKDMRAITHTALADVAVECRLEGDTFEMEDQRNWSDASYKSYVRPLALPWPYRIPAGAVVVQRIVLTVADNRPHENGSAAHSSADDIILLTSGEASGVMPAIGLVITPEEARNSLAALSQPGAVRVQDLLFHFDLTAGHGAGALRDFKAVAALHGGKATLEIAVPCQRPLDDEMAEIAAQILGAGFTPDAIMVCPSVDRQSTPPGSAWPDCPPLEDVYAAARRAFPGIRIGGGMLSYFTELNRKRVPAENLDFISHCTNPIVHAADDISVMQTLEALPFITRSVRAIYGDKPYRLGPSTIPMRQNPYGSRTMDNPAGGRIPMANRDPRHNGLFGAAFALGYAIRVADAGLETLSLSALTGSFGLFADKKEPMRPGRERPLAQVVRTLAAIAGRVWHECRSSRPDQVLALSVDEGAGQTVLLVNVTARQQTVDVSALGAIQDARLSVLDEMTMEMDALPETAWAGATITLPSFALARLRF